MEKESQIMKTLKTHQNKKKFPLKNNKIYYFISRIVLPEESGHEILTHTNIIYKMEYILKNIHANFYNQ